MTTREGEPAAAWEDGAPNAAADRRRQAEEHLDGLSATAAAAAAAATVPVPQDLVAAVHELRVHQIELEMQNEELRRAQLEAEEQRAKYFELFDLAPVGYLTLGETSIVDDANLTAARLLGVERQRLVGLPFSAFVFAEDRKMYDRLHLLLKRTGEPQSCELRLRRFGEANAGGGAGGGAGAAAAPAGHFWAHLEGRQPPAAAGQTPHSWVTFDDIFARKQAEESFKESEQNYRAVLDTVDDIILVATVEGRLVYTNPAVSAKLGYSAAELAALQVLDLHPPDKRGEAEAIFAAMFRGERDTCPLPLQSKSGALIPVETRVWLGRWNGADCMFGVSKNLTREQEALQKFERLFSGNPALMAVNSLPEGRFTEVNDAFLNALGYSREEVLGRTSEELGLFIEPEQQRAVAVQLQAQSRIGNRELKVRCKDGTILDGLFSGDIIESQGRQYFLTVMGDQTERKRAEKALRESEEKYRTVADFTYDWEAWRAPDGIYRYVSPSCERISGHAAAEFLADPNLLVQITHPDDQSRIIEHHHAADHEAQGQDLELCFRILTPSGELRWISHSCNAVYGEDGQWLGRRESNRDITARKLTEDALQVATARLSLATRAGGVGVWDYFVAADQLIWDDQMFALYGITREQFGGAYEAWQAGVHPDDRERGDAEIQMALRGEKEFDTDFRVLWPDGTIRDIRALALVQRDASGQATHMIGTNWDITAEKRAEEQIKQRNQELARVNAELAAEAVALEAAHAAITHITATDALTGLANRRHFHESLEKAISLARRHDSTLALVSLDLDGLKQVNDTFGQEAGDEVLTSFAALLTSVCRAEDLPGRLGGDEFSVLLPGNELDGARGLAERLLAAVRSSEALAQRGVTVSAGVAQWTPGELPGDLLRRADEALAAAKRVGGDATGEHSAV